MFNVHFGEADVFRGAQFAQPHMPELLANGSPLLGRIVHNFANQRRRIVWLWGAQDIAPSAVHRPLRVTADLPLPQRSARWRL